MQRCAVGLRHFGCSEGTAIAKDDPTLCFPAMSTMMMMMVALSGINQALLHLIHNKLPNSLTELAGHLAPNFVRALRMMEGCGLVALKRRKCVRSI
ncbi:hypothetical protein [Nitrosomonas communis]|uniref:hypothetical protein n=1 Tax=Nitrosomonas communis TaxID=44574 RepID=UPI0026EF0696|nr:hypothetical protein [Nitrosomonas communis]MCO6427154.1 hypothetical protein [Nitrosomonas communis]